MDGGEDQDQVDGENSKVSSTVLGVNRAVGVQVEDTGEKEIINTGLLRCIFLYHYQMNIVLKLDVPGLLGTSL